MKEFSELIKDKITSVYKEKRIESGYGKLPPYLPAKGYNYEAISKTGVKFTVDADHGYMLEDYDDNGIPTHGARGGRVHRYQKDGRWIHEGYYDKEIGVVKI